MNCERFADTLADLVERDVDESTRRSMEAHAQACADCGPLLADIRSLRVEASNLPELAPSRDLWSGIVERIETPVVALKASSTKTPAVGGRRWRGAWAGLAAAGLVAVTATVTYELTTRSLDVRPGPVVASVPVPETEPSPDSQLSAARRLAASPDSGLPGRERPSFAPTAPVSAAAAALVSNREAIEKTYDGEISRLRIVVSRRRSQLDSNTVAVLEKNLKVIDDAIAQCKDALGKDPNSRFLMESLSDALDTKVQLLRTAATMPTKA